MLNGIDISHYQTTTPDLTNEDFVFVKATDGVGIDPLYIMHSVNVLKARKVLGAYAFGYNLSPAYSAVDQAAAFLANAHETTLLALDLETSKIPMTLAQGTAFIAFVHASGFKIGLYASDSGFPNLGQDWNWVANWSVKPTRPWTFWQTKGGPLDQDVFNGDMTALLALAGKSTGATPMQSFTTKAIGSAKFDAVPNHACVTLDGSSWDSGWKAGTNWIIYGEITLIPPLPGGLAGANRADALLVMPTTKHDGTPWKAAKPACILRMDTDWPNSKTALPVVDTAALQKTAFNNAISYAVTAVQGLAKP